MATMVARMAESPRSDARSLFFLQLPLSSCVVSKKLVQVTPACITITDNTVHILIFGKE